MSGKTGWLARLAVSLREAGRRGGDEFEQGLFRILFLSLFLAYLLGDSLWNAEFVGHAAALLLAASYLLISVVILYAVFSEFPVTKRNAPVVNLIAISR